MDWTPFEERPRPPGLSQVLLAVERMQRIEIASDDEAVIGDIFAWLIGQVALARRGAAPPTLKKGAAAPTLDPEAKARVEAVLAAIEKDSRGLWRATNEAYGVKSVVGMLAMLVDVRAVMARLDYLEALNAKKPPAL
jgi:hypothetical protein